MTQRNTKRARSTKPSQRSQDRPSPERYQMVLHWSEEDRCHVITLPAWQNARTHGATPEEAVRNGREVLTLLIESAIRNGEVMPPGERLNLPASS